MLELIRRQRLVFKARTAARVHDWARAADCYRRAVAVSRPRARDLVQLGHALKHSGDGQGAEAAYREAAQVAPRWPEPSRQLGYLLWDRGRDAEAVEQFARALSLGDSDPSLRRIMGEAGLSPADQEFAILNVLSRVGPGANEGSAGFRPTAIPRRAAARKAARVGQWGVAASHYGRYLEVQPDDGAAWVQLGHCRRQLADLAGAEQAYRQALACGALRGDVLRHLGFVLRDSGKHQAARAVLQGAMALLDDAADIEAAIADIDLVAQREPLSSLVVPVQSFAVPVHTIESRPANPPPVSGPEHLSPVTRAELDAVVRAIVAAREPA